MTAPARLLSVRLQGFKSFAERTQVEFGPGISAVVGPNGSGKSNLADALRWALGEQGRALRTRKSEDVIWAGSERRPALGMADVQIVLDNADALLPVDFGLVELGRRLFRSGENEYLLNRQRVRLRDLVDLLDAAHLAENAFLFIGQGMVDQALALRPEERRPLFEEVAGVRRHERRRRRAEEQLAESAANLARVEDIVGELRPQVRRLAAQAQQQASRRDAGDELAEALLASTHARWHSAAARVAAAQAGVEKATRAADAAMGTLAEREAAAAGIAERLNERAQSANDARRALDAARDRLTVERMAAAQLGSEFAGLERDRERLAADRLALERDIVEQRRLTSIVAPAIDAQLESDLASADASLRDAERELAAIQASAAAATEQMAAAHRAEVARAAEVEIARRRAADLDRQVRDASARLAPAAESARLADEAVAAAEAALAQAATDETTAREDEQAARAASSAAEASARAKADVASQAGARVAAARGSADAARAAVASLEAGGFPSRARAAGGRRVDADLIVDPAFRAAVAAALAGAAGGYVMERSRIVTLSAPADERGSAIVEEVIRGGTHRATADGQPSRSAAERALMDGVRSRAGGLLGDAVRRDATGAASALLSHVAWVPALADALELQPILPAGWSLVTRDGHAVVTGATVSFGIDTGGLELRAEAERLAGEVSRLHAEAAEAATAATLTEREAGESRAALEAARTRHLATVEDRRRREADARSATSRAETARRELAWETSQLERLRQALERATAELGPATSVPAAVRAGDGGTADGARADLRGRVAELRQRRDRVAEEHGRQSAARADAERSRNRAESAIAFAERRLVEIDAATADLEGRATSIDATRHESEVALADARVAVESAEAAHAGLLSADADDRNRLGTAEREAATAREALRAAQERGHATEREALEARLAVESLREQVLVELASLGALALRHLGVAPDVARVTADGPAAAADPGTDLAKTADGDATTGADADLPALTAALDARAATWVSLPPSADAPPPARLASLRRRYHELGAANPYALEEHAELAARLEGLERQHGDLTSAIERTRALIAELDALIAGQFRTTFAALETAFDARFQQLFGGGFARLSLTEPGDLSATGIEITARPPGKKPQALAMLSGGERALTAVALLFAMLEIRPVPFCVLDEVDAALDEANVGRFTDALRSLSATTQFIVITHNRGTIETADALYGVTVGDDSVSRVISLRLDEATAIADSLGEPRPARAPIIPAGLVDPVPAAG